jgi:phosphoglycolate phosphatase-like HAD superfamily hydrolase
VKKKHAPIREWFEVSLRPEEVFVYLDDLSRHGEWQARVCEIHVDRVGPTTVGTRVTEKRRLAGLTHRLTYEIVEHSPPSGFAFRGVSGRVRPVGRRVIEPLDGGNRTRVTIEIDFEGKGIGKLLVPVVRTWAAGEIRRSQRRLKEVLEDAGSTRDRDSPQREAGPPARTLVFDFDGTIADSLKTLVAIFEEVTDRPEKLTATELAALRSQSLKEVIRELRIRPWQIPSVSRRMKKLAASRIPATNIVPGMGEALVALHGCGYRLVVLSTNSPGTIRSFLVNNGIDSCFSGIYGDIGLRGKTSALKRIAKAERTISSGCVYVGDEVRDIEAAKRAGLPSVGVAWGFTDPDALRRVAPRAFARTPEDLLQIARSIA